MNNYPSPSIDRRSLLIGTGAAIALVGADMLLSGCGDSAPVVEPTPVMPAPMSPSPFPLDATPSAQPVPPAGPASTTEAYIPTWLKPEEYAAMGQRVNVAGGALSRIHIAFAEPGPNGLVQRPDLSEGLGKLLNSAPNSSSLSIAVGGASTTAEAWAAAIADPERFAGSVEALRTAFEQLLSGQVHVDFDFELQGTKAADLTKLVQATRDAVKSDRQLTMAVPAGYMLDTFDTAKLTPLVDRFHVMSYDMTGPWDATAGPIATGPWVASSVAHWVQSVGDASKVQVGFPTYGYRFIGAQKPGDKFEKPKNPDDSTVIYTDLDPGTIVDDKGRVTSEAHDSNKNYISCLSPAMIKQIAATALSANPNLGGAFFWGMNGLTADHIAAVRA